MPPRPKGIKAKRKRFTAVKRRGQRLHKTRQETVNDECERLPDEEHKKGDSSNKSSTFRQLKTKINEGFEAYDQMSLCPSSPERIMEEDVHRGVSPVHVLDKSQTNLVMEAEDCYPQTWPNDYHRTHVSSPTRGVDNQLAEEGRSSDKSLNPTLRGPTTEEKTVLLHFSEINPASVLTPAVQRDFNAAASPKMHKQEFREVIVAVSLGMDHKEIEPFLMIKSDSSDGGSNSEHESIDCSTHIKADRSSNERSHYNNHNPHDDVDNRLLEDDRVVDEAPVLAEVVADDDNFSEAPDSPMVPEVTADTLQLLERVKSHLMLCLPISKFQNWNPLVNFDHGILVGLVPPSSSYVVQRSISVAPDGKVMITVHGKPLPRNHRLWAEIQNCVPLEEETLDQFSENILKIVASLRLYEICMGVNSLREYWKYGKGEIDRNRFKERRYKETLRPDSCFMLVNGLRVKRCEQCVRVQNAFSKRRQTNAKKGEGTSMTPKSTQPRSSMSSEERQRKDRDKKVIRNLKRKNQRLQDKVKRLVKNGGNS